MMKLLLKNLFFIVFLSVGLATSAVEKAENPIIFADVPDMSMVRV